MSGTEESKAAAASGGEAGKDKKDDDKNAPRAKYSQLYRYADGVDWALYAVGVFSAIVNGLTMPAFSLIFGELLDAFNPENASTDIMDDIRKFAIIITLVGVGSWIFSYLEIACFTIAVRGLLPLRGALVLTGGTVPGDTCVLCTGRASSPCAS